MWTTLGANGWPVLGVSTMPIIGRKVTRRKSWGSPTLLKQEKGKIQQAFFHDDQTFEGVLRAAGGEGRITASR